MIFDSLFVFRFSSVAVMCSIARVRKENIVLITANLNAEEFYKGNKFKLISYNYFADELFFALINKRDENNLQSFNNKYNNFIDNFNLEADDNDSKI